MDQSKLLQIINKDLSELKELAEELIQSECLSKIEIEIAVSKAKLVFQELELLKETASKENIELKKQPKPIKITEEKTVSTITEPEVVEPIQVSDNGNTKEPETYLEEVDVHETEQENVKEVDDELQDELIEAKEEKEIIREEVVNTVESEITIKEHQETPQDEINLDEDLNEQSFQLETNPEEDINIEDSEEEEPAIVIGETFSKGKSLNDALSESQTIDQKFASSPISKLEPAIGLNDRFLFIRELFDGNSDNFSKAVNDLDNFNNLKEAVDYLSTNYKWKKTETSLKFVELVKRRFQS